MIGLKKLNNNQFDIIYSILYSILVQIYKKLITDIYIFTINTNFAIRLPAIDSSKWPGTLTRFG